jgi:hypothetical protein
VIRVLYSRDINISVPDKTVKNRAYRLLLTDKLKIFKKNYLVKMLEVPLNVRVIEKKRANNSQLIITIYAALKIIALGL